MDDVTGTGAYSKKFHQVFNIRRVFDIRLSTSDVICESKFYRTPNADFHYNIQYTSSEWEGLIAFTSPVLK